MFVQPMMCIRNIFIRQTLPVINCDIVTSGNDGATFILHLPRIRQIMKIPFYWGSQIWNSLPFAIRMEENKEAYKKYIIQGLIDNTLCTDFLI